MGLAAIHKILGSKKVSKNLYVSGDVPSWLRGLNFVLCYLSPEMCQALLDFVHARNRLSAPQHVENLLYAMNINQWVPNPVPIIFDENGFNADGTHRLKAGERSKKGFFALIILNAPAEAIYAYDANLPRSAAQQAYMGGSNLSPRCFSIGKVMREFFKTTGSGRKINRSRQDVINYTHKHAASIKAVESLFFPKVLLKGLSRSQVAAAFARALETCDKGSVVEAAKKLITPTLFRGEEDAVLIDLREALLRPKERSNIIQTRAHVYKCTEFALNKWLTQTPHTSGSKLKMAKEELFPLKDDISDKGEENNLLVKLPKIKPDNSGKVVALGNKGPKVSKKKRKLVKA